MFTRASGGSPHDASHAAHVVHVSAPAWLLALTLALPGNATAAGPQSAAQPATGPVTHTVVIEGLRYSPPTVEARAGDTVVWINKDPFPHTVTAKNRSFDSGEIAPGRSWKFRARTAGVFPYVCTLHPTMKAVLVVKAD